MTQTASSPDTTATVVTTKVTVLPHPELCPAGLNFQARRGRKLVDELLEAGVAIEHACEKVCACATCHVHVRDGAQALTPPDDEEEDQLDDAWGVDAQSRLACCIKVRGEALVIELPRYTKNHAREK
ncbi:ISC system 2Fe-2S type ferredoxin [Roseateles cellulosilyticus]|uniref:2Fe-2S ferredoxin n=1 Tax=Pelomonas cellulosilytica TaxID=2906762 RepID=A0ABS8Y164_9BURK|nr:ISC system 2Fe-2S type ferredoxin [Pelomonas sp. P8]MCE4556756.1 ISC system 2Fe-2S type ferredoxin [Pelomonas sp. P8]